MKIGPSLAQSREARMLEFMKATGIESRSTARMIDDVMVNCCQQMLDVFVRNVELLPDGIRNDAMMHGGLLMLGLARAVMHEAVEREANLGKLMASALDSDTPEEAEATLRAMLNDLSPGLGDHVCLS